MPRTSTIRDGYAWVTLAVYLAVAALALATSFM
jgi:hypothetical protein